MAKLALDVTVETLRLAQPFRISGYVFTHSDVVVVTLRDGELSGRGEGGVYYLGDDVPHMLSELGAARAAIEAGPGREELRSIMPGLGRKNRHSTAKAERLLGWTRRSTSETIVDCGRSLIDFGTVT